MVLAPGVAVSAPEARRLVLLIDDQAEVRRVARRVLEAAGLAVVEAGDAKSGLELIVLGEAPVSLVLTDLAMPGIGGAEVAQVLGIHRPELPVVCMTGAASPDSVAELRRLRIPVLRKPFDPGQLAGVVCGLLDARPPTGARQRPYPVDLVTEALRIRERRAPGA